MNSERDQTGEDRQGNHPEVRQQLIALIRTGRRTAEFTRDRPVKLRFGEIRSPDSGWPLTRATAWSAIFQLLESGAPLKKIQLHRPPGEAAWVCRARLGDGEPLVYLKLQVLRGSSVLLRSFHLDEYDND